MTAVSASIASMTMSVERRHHLDRPPQRRVADVGAALGVGPRSHGAERHRGSGGDELDLVGGRAQRDELAMLHVAVPAASACPPAPEHASQLESPATDLQFRD